MATPTPMNPITGIAAGVPYLAFPPAGTAPVPHGRRHTVPLVFAWHLMDSPRSEAAFAAAVPLHGLNGWRIYLGLPMCGARLPPGGLEALWGLFFQDAVLKGYQPIAKQGAAEFPAMLKAVRQQLELDDGPLGPIALVGGSVGSAIAQLVLTEAAPAAGIEVTAAVLISPVTQLRPMVDAIGRRYNQTYPWGPEAMRVAEWLDFVARADDIVRAKQPAIRLIVGANDDREGFIEPAERLKAALSSRYSDPAKVDLVVIPSMGHALAEEPGIDPAPQTTHAAVVDQHTLTWLQTYLPKATV